MTARTDRRPRGPYRYLDYYNEGDTHLFFGREREIRILMADIVVNRLVVLFSKTGTGKTSLINAGVRPRLEPDYRTFYVRVEGDPTKAASETLRGGGLLPRRLDKALLRQQLEYATKRLQRPIVLFFDQFEEFFEQITAPRDRQRFIDEVAEIYQDQESGARIVFSMREEYFHEMDDFRDRVPSIFHKSSNLRLRPLDNEQALLAIIKPAKRYRVVIEDELVQRLIADLRSDAGILPVHLQIVCDTLWQNRAAGQRRITLEEYLGLGQGEGSPADNIYRRRIEKDLNDRLDDGQLELFQALMPELRTANQTKRPKELTELVERLRTDAVTLDRLVRLLQGIGLIRMLHRYGADHIEWTSDYLASRTDDLIERTRKLFLLRLIGRGLDQRQRSQRRPQRPGEAQPPPLGLGDFQALSEQAELVEAWIDAAKAEFLFSVSLYHGERMDLWSRITRERGGDVWQVLAQRITDKTASLEEVVSALRFLVMSRGEQARRLLGLALQQDALATLAVEVIAESGNDEAIRLLAPTLEQPALAAHTVAALGQQSSDAAVDLLVLAVGLLGDVALLAATALYKISTGRSSKATGRAARLLRGLLKEHAEPLFVQALDLGLEMPFWFEQAARHGTGVWSVLERSVQDPEVPSRRARNALVLLGTLASGPPGDLTVARSLKLLERALTHDRLADKAVDVVSGLSSSEAVQLLQRALQRDSTTLQAARSLYDIGRRRAGKASSEAGDVVQEVFRTSAEPLFLRALDHGEELRFWFDRAQDYEVDVWALIGRQIEQSDAAPDPAQHAVRLLGELANDPVARSRALTLLALAMQQDRVASLAVSTIGAVRAPEAVKLLGSALQDPRLSARARRALEGVADDWSAAPELQQRANALLDRPANQALAPEVTRQRRSRSQSQVHRLTASEPFTEHDWDYLLRVIAIGECTPVMGPGVSRSLPAPSEIAQQWAQEYGYPLTDSSNLAAVAQFLEVTTDRAYLMGLIRQIFGPTSGVPSADGAHDMLARLPIPVYLTTGFDDLTRSALAAQGKSPQLALPHWNTAKDQRTPTDSYRPPTPKEPLLFHLYGRHEAPESLVLTNDDYIQLVAAAAEDLEAVVPIAVQEALSLNSLLLLDVGPWELSGRVLLSFLDRLTPRSLRSFNVAVLRPPDLDPVDASRAQRYLSAYLKMRSTRVFWGDPSEFSGELYARWARMMPS